MPSFIDYRKESHYIANTEEHHAIVPTDKAPDMSTLNAKETELYKLIARHYVSAHIEDCKEHHMTMTIEVDYSLFNNPKQTFIVKGKGKDPLIEVTPLGMKVWQRLNKVYPDHASPVVRAVFEDNLALIGKMFRVEAENEVDEEAFNKGEQIMKTKRKEVDKQGRKIYCSLARRSKAWRGQ